MTPFAGAAARCSIRSCATAYVHVTYGTLADAPTLRPTAHIHVGSKAPWFTITDDLPQHQEF
jgi:hypothetical protein